MVKIIPFAVAVILVLAGGFYFFTSKLTPTPASEMQTTQPVVTEDGQTGEESAPSKPAEEVNEITLSVTSPENNVTVTTSTVTVKGVTLAGADVSVNEKDVVANASGNFSATIALEEGDNYVIVVAVDEDGNVAEKELTVTYIPPEE